MVEDLLPVDFSEAFDGDFLDFGDDFVNLDDFAVKAFVLGFGFRPGLPLGLLVFVAFGERLVDDFCLDKGDGDGEF